jgi:hypothetical protein
VYELKIEQTSGLNENKNKISKRNLQNVLILFDFVDESVGNVAERSKALV